MKTLEEYIAFYEQHSGEKFKPHDGCKLFFLPERGFCELKITDKMIIYYQLSGDARFWHDYGELLAGLMNINVLGTICTRNIKPYLRWWGYAVEAIYPIKTDEQHIYYARHKKNGRAVKCSPAWQYPDGHWAYYVTEYLKGEAE